MIRFSTPEERSLRVEASKAATSQPSQSPVECGSFSAVWLLGLSFSSSAQWEEGQLSLRDRDVHFPLACEAQRWYCDQSLAVLLTCLPLFRDQLSRI